MVLNYILVGCPCSVTATLLSGKTEAGRQDCKNIFFHALSSQRFLSAPMCGKYCKHSFNTVHNCCSTQKVIVDSSISRAWTPHAIFLSETTHFETVDIICQIWPIRGYTRSWSIGTGRLKKWLQVPPPFLSPVSSRFIFVFALSQFSGPDYLAAWSRLK